MFILAQTTVVFIFYFLIIYIIGFVASKRTSNAEGYLLGNRSFSPYVTALAAGASDMGSWLLLALPGAVYIHGLSYIWLPIGLFIGAYLNWRLVAKRLRIASYEANNSITLPEYLRIRFNDKRDIVGLTIAIISFIFFSVYTSSGFVAFSLLLKKLYSISYIHALLVSVLLTTVYVLIGGFIAVNWVDVFQATIMLFALLILPIFMLLKIGGASHFVQFSSTNIGYFSPIYHISWIKIVSLIGWGLGYFGQQHILVRFMAVKNPQKIPMARRIGMSWMFLCLLGSVCVGLFGAIVFKHSPLKIPEEIFIIAAQTFYHPLIAAVLISAIISAVMSTISAQILISSSALIEDILLKFIKVRIPSKSELNLDKFGVVIVAAVAAIIASDPHNSILNLVAYAWAGLGVTLGPAVLFALYWSKVTRSGIICGLVVGALTAIIWPSLKSYGGIFGLYDIVPGFIFASITIYIVSLLTQKSLEKGNNKLDRIAL